MNCSFGHAGCQKTMAKNEIFHVKIGQNLKFLDTWELYTSKESLEHTPHLKWKKLLNNSSWDFEHVLDTMDDYWVGQDENFCPESTPTRWRCCHFPKKWSKSKFDTTLSIKKPFLTPKFCGRNFSQMHHFEDMIFWSPLEPLYLSSSL